MILKGNAWSLKAEFALWALFAALLPLWEQLLPLLLGLLLVVRVLFRNSRTNKITRMDKGYLLLLIALYAYHVLGMLWSENAAHGLFDLQVKLPLVLLPMLLYSSPLDKEDLMNAGRGGLIFGALLSAVLCYAHLFYCIVQGWEVNDKAFSFYLHQGYHAALLCTGAFVLVELLVRHHKVFSGKARIAAWAAMLFMASGVFMTWSRTGAIVLVLGGLFTAVSAMLKWRMWRKAWLLLAGVVLLGVLATSNQGLADRFTGLLATLRNTEQLDKTATDANTTRIFLWEIGLEMVADHPLQGAGTGDIKDELTIRAKAKDYSGLAGMNLNVHNQFLQVFATLGLPAFLIFLAIIIIPLVEALRRRKLMLLLFAMLFAMFNLTESFIERQVGVMCMSFLLPLLVFHFRKFRSDAVN